MGDYLESMSLDDLKAMMVDVLRANPPARDRDFLHRLANVIAKKERVTLTDLEG